MTLQKLSAKIKVNIIYPFILFISVLVVGNYIANKLLKFNVEKTPFVIVFFFTTVWLGFYLEFFSIVEHEYLYIFILCLAVLCVFLNGNGKCIFVFTPLFFLPMIISSRYIGDIFVSWDAVVSWNRWAIEIFNGIYNPYNAGYPLLYPALWSLVYKSIGSTDLWWIAKLSNYILPTMCFYYLSKLIYNGGKSTVTILFYFVFVFSYLTSYHSFSGYLDIPVMTFGVVITVCLYQFYQSESMYERNYYLACALIISGISTVAKQAGFGYLAMSILIFGLNRHVVNKKFISMAIVLAMMYYSSFYVLYKSVSSDSVMGILPHLVGMSIFSDGFSLQKIISIAHYLFTFPTHYSIIEIPLIMIVLLLLLNKSRKKYLSQYDIVLVIFSIIGFVFWLFTTSYSGRNLVWIKPLFLMYIAMCISRLISAENKIVVIVIDRIKNLIKLCSFSIDSRKFILLSIAAVLIVGGVVNDDVSQNIQKEQQIKTGNFEKAKIIDSYMKINPDSILLTTDQPLKFNYLLKDKIQRIYLFSGEFNFDNFDSIYCLKMPKESDVIITTHNNKEIFDDELKNLGLNVYIKKGGCK